MFLDFFTRRNATICIDIGFRNIKVTEVKKKNNSNVVVEKFGMAKTPGGCISNGSIFDIANAVNTIGRIIRQNKMRARSSKIIMSGTNIITRVYQTEKIAGEDFDTTVKKRVIPYYLPMVMTDYQVEYKLLETIMDGDKELYKIFITAVPKVVLQSYVKVLNGLKLTPLAVDIPANSAAKFFYKASGLKTPSYLQQEDPAYDKELDTFAVLDFGSETTIVNIFQNKVLEFNRVILCGSSNIDDILSKELEIPTEEAEGLKISYGLLIPNRNSTAEHAKVNSIVTDFISKLTIQIQNCLRFYSLRNGSRPINKIFIMGGGSQLKELDKYLESILKIPVYSVCLLNLDGIKIEKNIEKRQLNYLVNSIGISL